MGHSLSSHGKDLDVGDIGLLAENLPPLDAGPLDLHSWFKPANKQADGAGNSTGDSSQTPPLELEIGSGKGAFIVQQAKLTPQVNYIGIEWAKAYWRHTADRCRRHALTNVRMLRGEAGSFVRNYAPDQIFRQVHIYFPDPWPKKRHHKRRLLQAPFYRDLYRVIKPGGTIRIATDHQEYFKSMVEHLAKVPELYQRLPFQSPESAGEGELVGSNFERKYRREGRPFEAMILRRVD
jgi:tRNA (guanine-N7-)-methyltransferase